MAALAAGPAGWWLPRRGLDFLHRPGGSIVGLALVGLVLTVVFRSNGYAQSIVALTVVTAIGSLGLNYAQGNAGMFTMAHAAFMAIGAYATAILTTGLNIDPILAIAAGVVVAGGLAAAFGLLSLRISEIYLAIATLALVQIVYGFIVALVPITHGYDGINAIPSFGVGGLRVTDRFSFSIAALVALALLGWLEAVVLASRVGRAFRAVREDPLSAAGCGVAVNRTLNLSFVLHATYSAIAGSVFAHAISFVDPTTFSLDTSIFVIAMLVLGGSGSPLGAILGAIILNVADEALRFSLSYRQLLYGLVIMLAALLNPGGLMGLVDLLADRNPRLRALVRSPRRTAAPRTALGLPSHSPGPNGSGRAALPLSELTVTDAAKAFGGVRALQGVSLTVPAGSIHALIGPNGSGKSTFINVTSGVTALDGGEARVNGQRISNLPAYRVSKLGVARTYQNGRLFKQLSVLENVQIAADHRRTERGPLGRALPVQGHAWVDSIISFVGIGDLVEFKSVDLGFGNQRRLELARALALDPDFLLLDEPAAGLTRIEQQQLIDLLRELGNGGMGVLLVEHTMSVVMGVADEVTVLDFGKVIGHGSPAEVQRDARVVEAYLGAV